MEDTCHVIRPDLDLKIDRSQNPRPELVPQDPDASTRKYCCRQLLTKPITFFGNSVLIRSVCDLVPTNSNSGQILTQCNCAHNVSI